MKTVAKKQGKPTLSPEMLRKLRDNVPQSKADLEAFRDGLMTLHALKEEVAALDEQLKDAKARLRVHEEETLPDLMDAVHMKTFTTSKGAVVEVKSILSCGNLTKPDQLTWLRKHGHDGLIRFELGAELDRGQKALVTKAVTALQRLGITAHTKEYVHNQTAKSFIREMQRDHPGTLSQEVLDLFGVYHGRKVEVTLPKEKKTNGTK